MDKINKFFKRLKNIIGPFGFVASLSAIVCIVASVFLVKNNYAPDKTAYLMILVFLCINVLGTLIIIFLQDKAEGEDVYDNLTVDILSKIGFPIIICKSNGSIFWSNKSFQHASDKTNAELRRFWRNHFS